jgi:hypothetical protein
VRQTVLESKANGLLVLRSRLLMDLVDEGIRGEYMAVGFLGNAQLTC